MENVNSPLQFLTKEGLSKVTQKLNSKLEIVQSTPDLLPKKVDGKTYLYLGESNSNFKKGHSYKYHEFEEKKWEDLTPSGGGGAVSSANGLRIVSDEVTDDTEELGIVNKESLKDGEIFLYTGETNNDFANGFYYKYNKEKEVITGEFYTWKSEKTLDELYVDYLVTQGIDESQAREMVAGNVPQEWYGYLVASSEEEHPENIKVDIEQSDGSSIQLTSSSEVSYKDDGSNDIIVEVFPLKYLGKIELKQKIKESFDCLTYLVSYYEVPENIGDIPSTFNFFYLGKSTENYFTGHFYKKHKKRYYLKFDKDFFADDKLFVYNPNDIDSGDFYEDIGDNLKELEQDGLGSFIDYEDNSVNFRIRYSLKIEKISEIEYKISSPNMGGSITTTIEVNRVDSKIEDLSASKTFDAYSSKFQTGKNVSEAINRIFANNGTVSISPSALEGKYISIAQGENIQYVLSKTNSSFLSNDYYGRTSNIYINNFYNGTGLFSNSNFNTSIIKFNCFTECVVDNMYYGWKENFNPVFPPRIISMNGVFSHCENFNNPVTIHSYNYPNESDPIEKRAPKYLENMFYYCENFNSSVIFEQADNKTISCANMFYCCSNFNQPIEIPDGVTNIYSMFCGCNNFNQPLRIPDSVTNYDYFLRDCKSFNSDIECSESINFYKLIKESGYGKPFYFNLENETYIDDYFRNMVNFNQPVTINIDNLGLGYRKCYSVFRSCYNFNSPIKIKGSNLNDNILSSTFIENCYNFNSPITFEFDEINTEYKNNLLKSWLKNSAYNLPGLNEILTFKEGETNLCYACDYSSYHADFDIVIPDTITNTGYNSSNRFDGNYRTALVNSNIKFNSTITLGSGISNLAGEFRNCKNFNGKVILPDSVKDHRSMFAGCSSYNQSITLPGTINASWMFVNCSVLNSDITIFDAITSLPKQNRRGMLDNCYAFRANIIYTNGVVADFDDFITEANISYQRYITDISVTGKEIEIYYKGTKMNTSEGNWNRRRFTGPEISIPEGTTDISRMFSGFENYNYPVTIPSSVTNASGLFANCYSFNQPVIIPDSVVDISDMFYGCENFNQPLTIPDSAITAIGILDGCKNFNSPITFNTQKYKILDFVKNTGYNIDGFMNQIAMPEYELDGSYWYRGLYINQPITLSKYVNNGFGMFKDSVIAMNFTAPKLHGYEWPTLDNGDQIYIGPPNYDNMFYNCEFRGNITVTSYELGTSMFENSKSDYPHSEKIVVCGLSDNLFRNSNVTVKFTKNIKAGGNTNYTFCDFKGQFSESNFINIFDGSDIWPRRIGTFKNCMYFNMPVGYISGYYVGEMFYNCYSFNQPITFNQSCDFEKTFYMDASFNSPITIISEDYPTYYFSETFKECARFNSRIEFLTKEGSKKVDNTYSMFFNCRNLTKYPNIVGYNNSSFMFSDCNKLRVEKADLIKIQSKDCSGMFYNCKSFESTMRINSNNISKMFYGIGEDREFDISIMPLSDYYTPNFSSLAISENVDNFIQWTPTLPDFLVKRKIIRVNSTMADLMRSTIGKAFPGKNYNISITNGFYFNNINIVLFTNYCYDYYDR